MTRKLISLSASLLPFIGIGFAGAAVPRKRIVLFLISDDARLAMSCYGLQTRSVPAALVT
jgi:hypothetical protein